SGPRYAEQQNSLFPHSGCGVYWASMTQFSGSVRFAEPLAVVLMLMSLGGTAVQASPATGPTKVLAGPPPAGSHDAAGPRPLAASALAHINSGNGRRGISSIKEYRAALVLMERYLAEGGHPGYDGDVALQLGKAFYELGDVPDARRAWWLGEKAVNAHTSLTPLIDRALYSATRHRVAEALQQLAEGYGAELSQVRFVNWWSQTTADGSPDLQFGRGVAALRARDLKGARRWFAAAADIDSSFAQARLCLAFLALARNDRPEAIRELLIASTSDESPAVSHIPQYWPPEGAHAARLLIALTAR
ncbi:MAG: hypothetical protein JWO66_1800, partial [Candidatus Eremiobacteraeota bacterium]|nr:hypothetical protein [Candidatus Eremiobacteraeota bacterium]